MTDRAVFLAAMRLEPLDDTLRLVFADWLEESGDGDRDKATAEFIRLSCGQPRRYVGGDGAFLMLREAYRWLEANWLRLVPEAAARHVHRATGPTSALSSMSASVPSNPIQQSENNKWFLSTALTMGKPTNCTAR